MRRLVSLKCSLLSAAIMFGIAVPSLRAESMTIRIRFANGKTGKPLRLKYYETGLPSFATGGKFHVDKIDGDSLVVTFQDVSHFQFRSAQYEPCDAAGKHAVRPQYDLHEIVDHGIVSPNLCGTNRATPVAGELLIYSRRDHWWEVGKNILTGLLICG